MARLVVIGTSDDIDITHGLRMLLEKYTEFSEVCLINAEENETQDQVMLLAQEKNLPVAWVPSLESLFKIVEPDDIFALAWDDSDECFEVVAWVSEQKNEIWDISDGLNLVDMESEVLEERLEEVLQDFTETLAALVYKMVMDQIDSEGKRKYHRP